MLEVLELRNICSFPAEVSDNRPAAQLVDALKCGIRVWDGYFFANWQNVDAEKIDAEKLVSDIANGSFDVGHFINAAGNVEAIEMLLWVDMVLKFGLISESDEHGGLFGIDVHELNFVQHPTGVFVDEDENCMDFHVDRIILAATGVDDLKKLEPLCLDNEYNAAETLAAYFDNLRRKKSTDSNGNIFPGKSWMLDSDTRPKMNVMKGNTRYVIELLPSKDVISYEHDISRRVRKTAAKIFKGFSAAGFGLHVDLSPLFEVGAESTSNTMNALLRGDYGVEGVRYGLNLIFSGIVKIKPGRGTPTCYVPEIAHYENGIVLSSFLPAEVMSQATYFERDGLVYWLPGKGMNIFQVETRLKSKTTHFREIFEHSNIDEEVGNARIKFNVG